MISIAKSIFKSKFISSPSKLLISSVNDDDEDEEEEDDTEESVRDTVTAVVACRSGVSPVIFTAERWNN
eukprot:CAMPEP_0204643214 /NCGR_PEP_ID=MMETSP0718-20130828/527_1 /ASSEMBLY_ACC=CAM_ASM_000674 /TAXON_ID=230516 /ORGANISM="Chaetoceros curvisetus" /LENGTH=68 /DNA_ID=CAMNT_0051664331 /DNA_START=221 /DNA_END=427 /DNA_ORIENTATION=-